MLTCIACHRDTARPGQLQCDDCRAGSPRNATDAAPHPEAGHERGRKPDASPDPFLALCEQQGLPLPTPEYRFSERRWRIDYAWPALRIALEVEGGAWTQGRHTRGKGFLADMAKYNELTVRGWRLIRTTPSRLCTADTLDLIRRAMAA